MYMRPSLIDVLAITFVAGALFALFGREAVETFHQVQQHRRKLRNLRTDVDYLLSSDALTPGVTCAACGGVGRCACSTQVAPAESPVPANPAEAV